jgi:PAS domain S-box-containing protein
MPKLSVVDDRGSLHEALAALREGEARLRAVFDSAHEGILVYDTSLKVVDANAAAERMVGVPLAQMKGKPGFSSLVDVVREDGTPLEPEERPTRITLATGEPQTGQVLGIHRADGSVTWISVNTALLRLPGESQVYGIVSTISDITGRKFAEQALRASEARFRKTFELAGSGIANLSLDGRFVRVNRSLCTMLGYSERELIGRAVKEISHPDDRDLTDAQRARVRSGELESVKFEKRYIARSGALVWVVLTVALVRDADGTPQYEIAVFDDVTERKQAHEELQRSNAELEQFASVASHDLQEPLRTISSYTQLLKRRHGERLDGDAAEFMGYIVDGAARMKRLIEDLLAYSRVGTHGKELRKVSVQAALERALDNLKAALAESGGTVSSDALPGVLGDELQLGQVFQNLIGNALKFRGKQAPKVHVGVSRDASHWVIGVKDNGIGIEPKYFERVFMLFQRLHGMDEYPGTGIGLAICKKVIERHGGRIWVESAPGEGSSFLFTLPRMKDA